MTAKDTITFPRGPAPKRIPRSCSDVFRLWAAVGLGIVLSVVFYLAQDIASDVGFRTELTPAQRALEEDYGANLIGWVTFAISYLWLGIRAFRGVGHAELVRRVLGSPLPKRA